MKESFWTKFYDLLAPRFCAMCSQRLSATESVICSTCLYELPYTNYQRNPTDNPMARMFWGHFHIEKAAALFFYQPKGKTSRLIHDMKYNGQWEDCISMGVVVSKYFKTSNFFDGIDVIIPMPVTRRRRWHRGYNQCEMIAKGIQDETGIPICKNVVKRIRFKDSQTKKNHMEQRSNVEGAFQLNNSDAISNKHLLLIDDIITTGSTITSCAKELCKAPGVKVSVLSIGLTKSM